ncbi:TIGR00730 family Rossman fold protein [Salirhabdus salicampi]|uniref:LOG family protein n=1 Tax=Salirhabdus salicampi TaxID=476102 RepID=UPI0020C55DF4|nr:TIGR00730 family Rossman fold protein [Salirhabdus salicampi]MCP8618125.1 TIGR00730 family Rossman fold protein [Salirhabdus salicampi]
MKNVCVFAGSNYGARPSFKQGANQLGSLLATKGIELIYGGSNTGLMGEVANEALAQNGDVTGVMPKGLFKGEIVHEHLTQLIEVQDMHERKAKMNNLSDGFIALPGGLGTFEELFEVLSWSQIGIHQKPIGILNIENYYTPLLDLIEHATTEQFMYKSHQELILSAEDPEDLLEMMINFQPPTYDKKWST